MSKAKEALKKVNVKSARVTNKGMLVVEVFSERDRESAFTRPKKGLSDSYKIEGAKMLLPKLIVLGIPSDMPNDDVISAIYRKNEQISQLVESSQTLEVIKCWDIKKNQGHAIQKKFS